MENYFSYAVGTDAKGEGRHWRREQECEEKDEFSVRMGSVGQGYKGLYDLSLPLRRVLLGSSKYRLDGSLPDIYGQAALRRLHNL